MSNPVDRTKLKVPDGGPAPSPETKVETVEDVFVVLTQAYCPKGHNLIDDSTVHFDGNPGISLAVDTGEETDIVVSSPIHGDHRKAHSVAFRIGTKLDIKCPTCGTELDVLLPCSCGKGELVNLYLTSELTEGQVAAICNVWGCPRSRVIDNWQIISQFVEANEENE